MKSLNFKTSTKNITYLVDAIGQGEITTVYQIEEIVNDELLIGLSNDSVSKGWLDKKEITSMTTLKALAVSKNATLTETEVNTNTTLYTALKEGKSILTFGFLDASNTGITGGNVTGAIDEDELTISLTVPSGSTVTALIATFTMSTMSTAKISTTAQVSGTTANNFTTPKQYIITPEFGDPQTYTVTVTVAS